jgi:hypothetical protein
LLNPACFAHLYSTLPACSAHFCSPPLKHGFCRSNMASAACS